MNYQTISQFIDHWCYFGNQFCDVAKSDDHPQEDLAKFGCK